MDAQPVSTDLVSQVQHYAESVLDALPPAYGYHNIEHTRSVARLSDEIGRAMGLADHALENVVIAAWLHDLGYARDYAHHEDNSKEMARPLLETLVLSEKRIEKVLACIDATRMPQRPLNEKEMVLCDADMAHLAAPDFEDHSEALRQEISTNYKKIGRKKWLKQTIQLMEQHRYFTTYAQQTYEPRKQQNLEKIRQHLAQLKAEADTAAELSPIHHPTDGQPFQTDVLPKAKRAERGIETMFRTTSTNHLQLSVMADNKANIMITVNSIIVSLVLSVLVRKLEDWPALVLPTVLLTTVNLVTTVFAILAVRPHITSGRFSREDIEQKKANLLFFGNFHQMELTEYEWGVREMMNDADFLYASMTRDIYYLGKVLGQKYKYLRVSYNVFMFGFITAVIAFGIAVYMSR